MNPSNYPDFERCKKLTELGFPMTENVFYLNIENFFQIGGSFPRPKDTVEYVCPSVSEIVDLIPHYIKVGKKRYEFNIRMNGDSFLVMYVNNYGMTVHFTGTLSETLSDLIVWLVENGHLTFDKR